MVKESREVVGDETEDWLVTGEVGNGSGSDC